jgi:hypothetical protein
MEAHKDMNKHQRIATRIAISTSVGILVAAIARLGAWRSIGWMPNVRPEQPSTQQLLELMKPLIEAYCTKTKTVPQSRVELRHTMERYSFTCNEDGIPLDTWGHPFLYSVKEGHPVVTSYGRDGKPGGVGFDCDLSSDDKSLPRENMPTFFQFLVHPAAKGIVSACLACGVLAFLVSLVTVNPAALHGWAILSLIVKLTVTILGTLFVAFIMSIAEIPNYH